ncbi:hypothetical protein CDAR_189461 [Caerostris darwini]|uniref:Uncharacterized protein n=1 Tax=Caerostris darwini TaxID=1538125 RepID=A0AAV4QY09_9ARAC|nr:hypothetical protein CDAR_189461 [Caerostris darwini]
MSFHSQTAWSPNQHINPALTSGGITNRRFANICFCKPLAGFLNQKDQLGEISPLFRPPPNIFSSFISLRRNSGMSTNRNWCRAYGEVQGAPDLHVNYFPAWLQKVPLFVCKGIDNAAEQRDRDRTDLCFSSRARYLPTIPSSNCTIFGLSHALFSLRNFTKGYNLHFI